MILHIENSKESIKLSKLIHEFSNTAGYRNQILFLYTSNKQSKMKLRKNNSISKGIKKNKAHVNKFNSRSVRPIH